MIIRLVQLYVAGIVLMLLYLLIGRDMGFTDALEPSLLWPKTLIEMLDSEPVPT